MSLKRYEGTEALYRQVLTLEPSNLQAIVGLSASLMGPVYNRLVTDAPDPRGSWEGARLAIKAKELGSSNPNIYVNLGVYAAGKGDFDGSRLAAEKAVALEPNNPDLHNHLADTYIDAGEPTKAIEHLTKAVRLDPRRPHEFVLGNMGHALFMVGDDEAAIKWLLKAVDANPSDGEWHAYLAMTYARRGDQARSRVAAETLLRLEPTFRLSKFVPPRPGYPSTYKEFWETKQLAAGRLAGLPE